ncbi:hypothetical protein QO010_002725 [Caulobacter ginsengisoli]|uniref:GH84 domain-containing protein n=1 Tax=Caulobacter ginsengisoli TaxID=400775 RepID=A0ABU0IUA7_9CAUL|nr:beta-N-acetylglucosaminidase domain-containing protein [Caulobacter ginsengisoli]MDQ0464941.1 hypothetical protein [Caulobacter ginsengisoli]
MTPPLGIIEGYYGRPWSWADRVKVVDTLAPAGYRFYLYAPKADPYLRRRWAEPHPDAEAESIAAFARHCAGAGVAFGVGLSPYEIYRDFDTAAQQALAAKLAHLDSLGVVELAILFDDMRGDTPDLAASQVRILHWIAERTAARRLTLCPTYYSDDPVLDRFFGTRPERYLETLGQTLDPAIAIFWTGEEVCSRELAPGHLDRVAQQLSRPPLLWDNWPVNDGPRMSRHLHLRAFTGRPAANAGRISGHAVNPALQPTLSLIPALTLADAYAQGAAYGYTHAWRRAAEAVAGPALADLLQRHILAFQDGGLDTLDAEARAKLRAQYAAFDHPAAAEVVAWLDEGYRITREEMEGQ